MTSVVVKSGAASAPFADVHPGVLLCFAMKGNTKS